jgi:hypothetical protein
VIRKPILTTESAHSYLFLYFLLIPNSTVVYGRKPETEVAEAEIAEAEIADSAAAA